jgi:hypothetical protein
MTLNDGPSLGNITGTHLDSACKHIQQCKVSFDHMILFAESADELDKEKMKYCAHKDEVIVGIGRPWKVSKVRNLPPSAYPRIVSNLGNISKNDEKYSLPRKMITFLFHTATDVFSRRLLIDKMNDEDGFSYSGNELHPGDHYFEEKDSGGRGSGANKMSSASGQPSTKIARKYQKTSKYLDRMFDYYPVGICNTLAYANPRSGDTVGSVMIGGLRTVLNGDWEVHAGDLVQWYWTFEKGCFRADGTRNSFMKFDGDNNISENHTGMSPFDDLGDEITDHESDSERAEKRRKTLAELPVKQEAEKRRIFNDRQYGIQADSLTPSDKSKSVARIKTYHKDARCPRIYDALRIIGRAIGTARPGELLDIQINRQSM